VFNPVLDLFAVGTSGRDSGRRDETIDAFRLVRTGLGRDGTLKISDSSRLSESGLGTSRDSGLDAQPYRLVLGTCCSALINRVFSPCTCIVLIEPILPHVAENMILTTKVNMLAGKSDG
jgi:hypothetical protein